MRPRLFCVLLLFCGVGRGFSQDQQELTNSIGMKLVLIHPGTFAMGSPEDEEGRISETQHTVTLSTAYYLGTFEVSQREYELVMGDNPSEFKERSNPVEMVSWTDAVAFCRKLSELPQEKAAGRKYRLPTEAEWEYACRAGSTTTFSFGQNVEYLGEYAWFEESKTHSVGQKKPNRWGLYDMHGNVWEWCWDLYRDFDPDEVTDPKGAVLGGDRVIRGGGVGARSCRSASRAQTLTPSRHIGFRVALSPSGETTSTPDSSLMQSENARPAEIINGIAMKLALIPAGSFIMGSPHSQQIQLDPTTSQLVDENLTQHEVTISSDFFMGVHEVTQGQYEKVMGSNPAFFPDSQMPVPVHRWEDAVLFCKRLSELPQEKAAGREYRLPTEAEWEYACRAGSDTEFSYDHGSATLVEYAWFDENSESRVHPVGEKMPNRWGLHDMHGNMWEWCQDWYGEYSADYAKDPQGPTTGTLRVLRGGSWVSSGPTCRSAFRNRSTPVASSVPAAFCPYGFRVAVTALPVQH